LLGPTRSEVVVATAEGIGSGLNLSATFAVSSVPVVAAKPLVGAVVRLGPTNPGVDVVARWVGAKKPVVVARLGVTNPGVGVVPRLIGGAITGVEVANTALLEVSVLVPANISKSGVLLVVGIAKLEVVGTTNSDFVVAGVEKTLFGGAVVARHVSARFPEVVPWERWLWVVSLRGATSGLPGIVAGLAKGF